MEHSLCSFFLLHFNAKLRLISLPSFLTPLYSYNVIKNWDYKKLIEAFSNEEGKVYTVRCKTQGEFVEALEKAKAFKGLAFLELILDKDDCSKHLLEWGSRVATANGRAYVEL